MGPHAVIVAGGAGSRLAASAPVGTPLKPLLVDADGARLIDRVLAATAGCRSRVVVAGEMDLPADVVRVREDPPMSGPAAAVVAGVRALPDAAPDDRVLLLAADLVDPAPAVAALLAAAGAGGAGGDGAVGVVDGRFQPLLSVVRYGRLYELGRQDDFVDAPVMSLLRGLDLTRVDLDSAADVDTWEEARDHGFGSELG